jgi:hypothetical protein
MNGIHEVRGSIPLVSTNLKPPLLAALCFWVSLRIDVYHFFHRDLRVDLCGGKPGVAEKFLDIAKVGAGVEHMRREGVPQRVWRDLVNVSALLDVFVDHPPNASSRDPRALIV